MIETRPPLAWLCRENASETDMALALNWLADFRAAAHTETLVVTDSRAAHHTLKPVRARRRLLVMTEKTYRSGQTAWSGGPALSLWTSARAIDDLEHRHSVTALAVIPYSLAEIEPWLRARQPYDLLGTAPTPAPPTITNPVVRSALDSLRLSRGSSRDETIVTFQVLHRAGYVWDRTAIRAWALADGWRPDQIDRMLEFADGVVAGHRFRVRQDVFVHDVLDVWRQQSVDLAM